MYRSGHGRSVCARNLTLDKWGQEDLWDLLAGQPSMHGEPQCNERPFLKEQDSLRSDTSLWPPLPLLHRCVHTNAEHACIRGAADFEVILGLHTHLASAEFPLSFTSHSEETSWPSS